MGVIHTISTQRPQNQLQPTPPVLLIAHVRINDGIGDEPRATQDNYFFLVKTGQQSMKCTWYFHIESSTCIKIKQPNSYDYAGPWLLDTYPCQTPSTGKL